MIEPPPPAPPLGYDHILPAFPGYPNPIDCWMIHLMVNLIRILISRIIESLYEEIEPDISPSLKIKSKQTVNHQDIQEIEQDAYGECNS